MQHLILMALFLPEGVVGQGLFEQAVAGESATPEQEAAGNVQLGGYVRGSIYAGKRPTKDASEIKAGYGEVALETRARSSDFGDAFGELRLQSGMHQGTRKTDIQLREALVNLYLGSLDVRFGRQIIAWGRADGFNPTDNLTPRDMNVRSANEDDRRLGNLALRLFWNAQPLRIEAVWVPFFAPSRFPDFDLPAPLTRGEPNEPDQNPSKGIGALRLHIETPALEGSASYLVGHATFPGIRLDQLSIAAAGAPVVQVGFSSYRHQVVGVDFATTVGDSLGLRGEAAFRRPFDYETRKDVPLPDIQYVVGIDGEPLTDVTLIAQYIGRYVCEWEELPKGELPADPSALSPAELVALSAELPRLIDLEIKRRLRQVYGQQERSSHAGSVRLAWSTLHETLTLEVLAYYSFSYGDAFVRPKATYAVADALGLTIGGEIYHGPDDTLYGMVDEILSAGFVELRLSF